MKPDEKSRFSRRSFLRAAGAIGIAAGCAPIEGAGKLVPYLDAPENVLPGTPSYYRTLCRECGAGCGVTATVRDGRVTKLEGNPDDPTSGGALCARGQAGVQALYSPDRLRGPMARGADGRLASISWDDAIGRIADAVTAAKGKVAIWTRPEPGSAGALQKAFLAAAGAPESARWVVDPGDVPAIRAASARLYGIAEMPAFDLSAARSVVSFGADFLETWISPVRLTREFMAGRGRFGEARTRLTWIAPRLSATGAVADRWLPVAPGSEAVVALGLLRALLEASPVAGMEPLVPLLAPFDPESVRARSGVGPADLARIAAELLARRPSAILGPGLLSVGSDAETLAVAIALINHALGNVGKTVLHGTDPMLDPPTARPAEPPEVLFLHHADPPGDLLAKIPLVVGFAGLPGGANEHAHLILPDRHALESFGDLTVRRGLTVLGQPAMTPVADTRAASETLIAIGTKIGATTLPADFPSFVQSRLFAADAPAKEVRAARAKGVLAAAPAASAPLPAPKLEGLGLAVSAPPAGMTLVAFPTATRNGPPWLSEVADSMSAVAWVPWAELSPAAAGKLGASTGDRIAVETAGGSVELPLFVNRGLHDDAVALPSGPEAATLLPGAAGAVPATVRSLRRAGALPRLSVVADPVAPPNLLRTVPDGAPPMASSPPEHASMYEPPRHPERRWAMVIDLDRCSGCNACSVACYAENNIPVLGPQRMDEGRSMAWIRIERYWAENPGGVPRADFLPMLCQQCDSAPCETVCPVYATYHNSEGLNAQVYNRCVGTRYCANNCPYKVRSFNYQDASFPDPLPMQLNPDVTVRTKGVMEKCTFCVQRIRRAELAAEDGKRPVADGEVVPACAQTCPAQAIVFGDANDPASRVVALAKDPRGFRALEELATGPAITYLARVVAPEEKS